MITNKQAELLRGYGWLDLGFPDGESRVFAKCISESPNSRGSVHALLNPYDLTIRFKPVGKKTYNENDVKNIISIVLEFRALVKRLKLREEVDG